MWNACCQAPQEKKTALKPHAGSTMIYETRRDDEKLNIHKTECIEKCSVFCPMSDENLRSKVHLEVSANSCLVNLIGRIACIHEHKDW